MSLLALAITVSRSPGAVSLTHLLAIMLRLRILLDGLGLLLLDSLGHHRPAKKRLVSTGLDL